MGGGATLRKEGGLQLVGVGDRAVDEERRGRGDRAQRVGRKRRDGLR